ncbi:MAG: endolytic transglycosylase MltG [Acidimicrobiales bacterium]|nr:endolytic transglycosylase MltG [Acidimicrobiales bacterium]
MELGRASRVPRWVVALGVVVVVLALFVGGGWYWYQTKVDPPGGPGESVSIEIPQGATTSRVGDILDQEGVITSSTLFGFYVGGKDLTAVQAGIYEFRENSSFDDAIEVLNAGPDQPLGADTTSVGVPEGLRLEEMLADLAGDVDRFSVEGLEGALADGSVTSGLQPDGNDSFEGLLFPATYEIDDETTEAELLSMMAAEMEGRASTIGLADAAGRISGQYGLDLDTYDLLVVASLVHEEAGSPEEAPKIAAVIYNRLAEGTPLGIDATSRYLAELEGTEVDFESDSPYNTRRQAGLPPTPIASPGEYALAAAANPADGPWTYYVLTDPGVHTFTDSYQEFLAAKDECIAKDLGCG